jgi:hypothetical protein
MHDFHPTSEVIYSYPLFTFTFNHAPLYWSRLCHFLQDIVPAPLARTISYRAQSLPWDINLLPWLNWCPDMPH